MEFNPEKKNNQLEKQEKWGEIANLVNRITDGKNHPVDAGIKETVIAFIANDLETDGSCEGHLNRGRPYPWIHLSFKITDKDELAELEKQAAGLFPKIKEQGIRGLDEIKEKAPEFYAEAFALQQRIDAPKNLLKLKIDTILSEFYSVYIPEKEEYKIVPVEAASYFVIEPAGGAGIGKLAHKAFDEKLKKMSTEEKETFLKQSQKEMKMFTEFLKNKFFND